MEPFAGGQVGEGGNAVVVDAESVEMGKWSEIQRMKLVAGEIERL